MECIEESVKCSLAPAGKRWTSQRNFSVKHLRNFGFGKKDLGVVIEREAAGLVQHLLDGGQQVGGDQELRGQGFRRSGDQGIRRSGDQ